ncbi:hypothetical protein BASA81_001832 [Batrachochytrium salamandrivorans]|nr:hypothetical protein BASA81_001832 [Batrachochytrium salamandrivorans]
MSVAKDEYPIGQRIHVVLKSKREITGAIFAVDLASSRLILEEDTRASAGAAEGFRDTIIICLGSIHTTALLGGEREQEQALFPLTQELASKREKLAFQSREAALLKAPKSSSSSASSQGVPTQLGQDLFNALSKMYECRWRANFVLEIVVLGVVVKPPYRHNDVSGHDNRAVIRVKELVGKIQLKH